MAVIVVVAAVIKLVTANVNGLAAFITPTVAVFILAPATHSSCDILCRDDYSEDYRFQMSWRSCSHCNCRNKAGALPGNILRYAKEVYLVALLSPYLTSLRPVLTVEIWFILHLCRTAITAEAIANRSAETLLLRH